jgi:hypothetical protein
MPRVQETSLCRSEMRIVFSVLNSIRTEIVNSTEATQPEILTLAIFLTDHSLARGDSVTTAEERLATRASSTYVLIDDRTRKI